MGGEKRRYSFTHSGLEDGVKTTQVLLSNPGDGPPACVLTYLRRQKTRSLMGRGGRRRWEQRKAVAEAAGKGGAHQKGKGQTGQSKDATRRTASILTPGCQPSASQRPGF